MDNLDLDVLKTALAWTDSGRRATLGTVVRTWGSAPRPIGAIGYAALRGGDVIGDHTVIFAGPKERIELAHKAGGREIYAEGALRAALWVFRQKPGLYSMRDVLGLV